MWLDVCACSQLSQVKSFLRGQVYESATDSLTGQVSLEEFSRLMKQQELTDELRHFGLTDEEIAIKLKYDAMTHNQVCYSLCNIMIIMIISSWDVTVTYTMAQSYLPLTSQTSGAVAEAAVDRKTAKCAPLTQAYSFMAIAAETWQPSTVME